MNDLKIYPCADCGKPRTKAEGGTTFTVCDDCWDKAYPEECSNAADQGAAIKTQSTNEGESA